MSAYVVASYRVANPAGIAAYTQAAGPTIAAHGGEVLAADRESEVLEGEPAPVTVIIRFPGKEAARAWYTSPEYQAIKHLRTDNSTHTSAVLVNEFVLPAR